MFLAKVKVYIYTENTTTQTEQLETKQKENTQCHVKGTPTNVQMSGTQAQHYH